MKHSDQTHYYSVLDPKVAGMQEFIPRGEFGRFKLWFDPVLNKQYEEYTVSAFGTEKEFEIYQFRRDQWQNLIGVYHVAQTNSYGFKQLRVFTERIPKLLSEMLTISFIDYLYILRESLIGFQAIVERFGYIHVQDRMIGINSQGKVRVWSNSKYQKNHSQVPIASANWINSKKYEQEMVHTLFDSLDKHAENGQQFRDFQSNKPTDLGFIQATHYLLEYITIRGIKLPDFLQNYLDQQNFKRSQINHSSCTELFSKPSISTNDCISSSQNFEFQKNGSGDNFCKSLQHIESHEELVSSQSYQNINYTSNYFGYTERTRMEYGDGTDRSRNQWVYDPYKKTKYFGEEVCERRILKAAKSKSKQKVVIKCSWTSKDMSFKSTTHSGQKKNFDKKNIFNRVAINPEGNNSNNNYLEENHDESFMIDSSHNNYSSKNALERPRSLLHNLTSEHFQITKSVVVENKPEGVHNLEGSRKAGFKNLMIETGFSSDISLENPTPSAPTTPQTTKVRNLKSLNQFKEIFKSIIRPSDQKQRNQDGTRGLAMISQLKSSFFNKIDDLKKSQIISEHLESSEKSSNFDSSSPLLCKTRISGLRSANNEPTLGMTRCSNEESTGQFPFQSLETGGIHRSAVNSKSRTLNAIVEADGQQNP